MADRMIFFFNGLFYVTFYDILWYVLNLHICDALNGHLITGTKMLQGSSRVEKWVHPWWQNTHNFISEPNWLEDSLGALHLCWYNLNEYLRWLWMPGQCCPAGVHCTQPVCAACLAPVPSPGHCRICQQASGSARSSRSYQGLQQAKREEETMNETGWTEKVSMNKLPHHGYRWYEVSWCDKGRNTPSTYNTASQCTD